MEVDARVPVMAPGKYGQNTDRRERGRGEGGGGEIETEGKDGEIVLRVREDRGKEGIFGDKRDREREGGRGEEGELARNNFLFRKSMVTPNNYSPKETCKVNQIYLIVLKGILTIIL